jgi:hypothetical protein
VSASPFDIRLSQEAADILHDLAKPSHHGREKKVKKALRILREVGPSHPGLNSHKYQSITGPNGEGVWESYVENRTPSAWRIWWWYGPDEGQITILTMGPHP